MKKLKDNWLTEGLIDFEYKQYLVLSYLQSVKGEFEGQKLYPTLSDLVFHYKNLITIRDNQQLMYQHFPQEISKADFRKLELSYRKIVENSEIMNELTDILSFAIPKFKNLLEEGKDLYEALASQLEIEPVGISPIRKEEGYLFMQPFRPSNTLIYYYQTSIFESAEERFRGINLRMLDSIKKGIGETYENLKLQLIRKYQYLPNPATFLIISKVPCPMEESLLPISKRLLMQQLMQ